MAFSLQLGKEISALFFIVFIGFLLVRKNILHVKDASVLSKLVLYVCGPATVLYAFQIELTKERVQGFLLAFFFALFIEVFYIIFTKVISRYFYLDDVERMSIIYPNTGNLIVPLVSLLFGEKMVFYASGFMIVQNIFFWTHCLFVMSKQRQFSLKAILSNINMIAIFVGLFLFLFQIKLPSMIQSSLQSMKMPLGSLSMLVVGMLLSSIDFKKSFGQIRPYMITFLRLIVCPLLGIAIIYIFKLYTLFPLSKNILMISVMGMSGPAASTVTQFAQLYHNNPEKASIINTLTFVFCIITIPFMSAIYSLLVGL